MTKEEIEKEAEEKYFNHKNIDFQGFYSRHYYYLGYEESAEPREKRIAELEKENNKLKSRNDELINLYNERSESGNRMQKLLCKRNSDLEKENAELNKKLSKAEQFLKE